MKTGFLICIAAIGLLTPGYFLIEDISAATCVIEYENTADATCIILGVVHGSYTITVPTCPDCSSFIPFCNFAGPGWRYEYYSGTCTY